MTNPRYDEQFRRGYVGPPVQPAVRADEASAHVEDDAMVEEQARMPVADAQEQHEGTVASRPFHRNPFAIALLTAGVLMLIAGVWMLERSISLTSILYTPEQQAVIQAESQLSAPVLTGGVVAIVAWLVLGAFAVSAARRVD